ncbi:hypothetical protein [Serratia liquefaciens]|uniref:hypothetical protein n=1 Tax=Serratia liquefaciens TaxID=614 RepID=UPI002182A800|nr:hypothetical protein [Serratia liquefaciens]CAI2460206.1 Uncharacterised protein [Serratia liquefaciens]
MRTDFEVVFFSDSRYEELTAEISYKDQILCQLNKDKGIDNIEVEFFADARILAEQVAMKFPLNEFLAVLEEAKQDLIE